MPRAIPQCPAVSSHPAVDHPPIAGGQGVSSLIRRNAPNITIYQGLQASGRTAISELKYFTWDKVEKEHLNPLFERQFMVGDSMMIAKILLRKGSHVPLHSHHNEQITYILKGALRFNIDNREIIVSAGQCLIIPPHMPHEAFADEDTIDLDIFSPPREDWINKSDGYLRNAEKR